MPNLKHCHIRMFCDNIPTFAWANILTSKHSISEGRLLRTLALRQRWAQVSPLLTLSISGEKNDTEDLLSQAFQYDKHNTLTATHPSLAHQFNLHFPLSQKQYWQECCLENVTTTDVISELLGRWSQMALWTLIIPQDKNTGTTGAHMSNPSALTLFSKQQQPDRSS